MSRLIADDFATVLDDPSLKQVSVPAIGAPEANRNRNAFPLVVESSNDPNGVADQESEQVRPVPTPCEGGWGGAWDGSNAVTRGCGLRFGLPRCIYI